MSEDTKKDEETELEAKAAELSEQDLNKVAGAGAGSEVPTEIVVTRLIKHPL